MSTDQAERGPYQMLQELDAGLTRLKDTVVTGLPDEQTYLRQALDQQISDLQEMTATLLGEGDAWSESNMHRKTTEEILSPDPRTPTHRSE